MGLGKNGGHLLTGLRDPGSAQTSAKHKSLFPGSLGPSRELGNSGGCVCVWAPPQIGCFSLWCLLKTSQKWVPSKEEPPRWGDALHPTASWKSRTAYQTCFQGLACLGARVLSLIRIVRASVA